VKSSSLDREQSFKDLGLGVLVDVVIVGEYFAFFGFLFMTSLHK